MMKNLRIGFGIKTRSSLGGQQATITEWHYNGAKSRCSEFFNYYSMNGDEASYAHGKDLRWTEDGVKIIEYEYVKGNKNGKAKEWYENGALKYEGEWKDGKKNGKSIEWYENGIKKSEHEYKNDISTGKGYEWYENGVKKM